MKLFLAITIFSLNVFAAPSAEKAVPANAANPRAAAGTGRSHNFEDLLVNGKYHFADEAVSTVEADKVFDSLIGVRNDFKDRLEDSASKK